MTDKQYIKTLEDDNDKLRSSLSERDDEIKALKKKLGISEEVAPPSKPPLTFSEWASQIDNGDAYYEVTSYDCDPEDEAL